MEFCPMLGAEAISCLTHFFLLSWCYKAITSISMMQEVDRYWQFIFVVHAHNNYLVVLKIVLYVATEYNCQHTDI